MRAGCFFEWPDDLSCDHLVVDHPRQHGIERVSRPVCPLLACPTLAGAARPPCRRRRPSAVVVSSSSLVPAPGAAVRSATWLLASPLASTWRLRDASVLLCGCVHLWWRRRKVRGCACAVEHRLLRVFVKARSVEEGVRAWSCVPSVGLQTLRMDSRRLASPAIGGASPAPGLGVSMRPSMAGDELGSPPCNWRKRQAEKGSLAGESRARTRRSTERNGAI